jgi:glycosyltransferase involved in cell wall biosynthesis
MDIINKLASIGVTPAGERSSIEPSLYVRDNAHPFRMRRQLISLGKVMPLVSCLMVTRGDRWTIKYALESYRRQTYANKELIIVVDNVNYDVISALIKARGIENVGLFAVDPELSLGDCRNMSVARARGEVLIQWDDDDLYDPLRIAVSVSALTKTSAAAALLSRWLVWWPSRDLAAISGSRIWEGSMAVWREHAPVYPNMARGEDTYVTECIANSRAISSIDDPLLYTYIITEHNTFDTNHYDKIFAQASYVARDEEYRDLIELLSSRIPILEYEAELNNSL